MTRNPASRQTQNTDFSYRCSRKQDVELVAKNLLWDVLPEISSVVGEPFFSLITGHVADCLNVDIVYIANLADWEECRFTTLAAAKKSEPVENFSFVLSRLLCRDIFLNGIRCFRRNLQEIFPAAALQVPTTSSCLALPLKDAADEPIGLMVLLWEESKESFDLARAVLGFLAARISGELERQRANEVVEEQLHFMQQLVDAIPTPIFFKNRNRRYIGCNKQFEQALGSGREQIIGKTVWDIAPEDFASTYDSADKALLDSGRAMEYEGNMVYGDGTRRDVVFNKAVFHDSGHQVAGIVGTMFDLTAQKKAEQKVHQLANFDLLTGLPNRTRFIRQLRETLQQAAFSGGDGAVLCLDLDKFKLINDTFGHQSCNRMLSIISQRLQDQVGNRDLVGRISGDRFAVSVFDLQKAGDVESFARRLLAKLRRPIELDDQKIHLSVSIGCTLFPNEGSDAETLLRHADRALSRAKKSGRNTIEFFSRDMNVGSRERLNIDAALHRALENNEFTLHYQPQVELASGRLVGAEALLRWNSPELGKVSPEKFIPLAEENGLILKIGTWVLREACRQNRLWQDRGYPPIRVAVNLSSHQMRQHDFVEVVRGALAETALAGRWLELELTESALMDYSDANIHLLQELKQLGIHLSIDDFGTGYSSLNYLKRFPLDKLKIDRSFVRDIPDGVNDVAITEAILAMAHRLGLSVVAEGIETEGQLSFLQSNNCIKGQGFLFGAAVPASDFTRFFGTDPDADHRAPYA